MIHIETFKERLTKLIGDEDNQSFERKTGVSEANIRKYLKGDGLPTLKVLEKIAEANRVSIGWLIGEEETLAKAVCIHQECPNKSMQDMVHWINDQNDGINYWEILKGKLAQEYPDFKTWLVSSYSGKKEISSDD